MVFVVCFTPIYIHPTLNLADEYIRKHSIITPTTVLPFGQTHAQALIHSHVHLVWFFFLHLLILPAHSFDCTFHTPTKNDLTHCFFFSSSPTKPRLTDLFYNARAYWWAIDGVIFHNHSHVQHDSAIIQLKIPLFLSVCFFVFTKHHCTITTMSNWIVVAVFAHSFFPRYFRCCKLNWENWQAPAIILPYMLL